jgi:phosphocarrier protein HPr
VRQKITILIKSKLYLRFLRELQSTASHFKSRVTIQKGEMVADAKSFMEVLSLIDSKGSRLEIVAEGEDAPRALETVRQLAEESLLKFNRG